MEFLDALTSFHELDLLDLLDDDNLFERLPRVFNRSRDVIDRLFAARSPAAILAVGGDLGTALVRPALSGVARFVGGHLGIVLSFVTTSGTSPTGTVPDAVRAAYLGYFFGDGYLAADGTQIVHRCSSQGRGRRPWTRCAQR